MNEKYSIAIDGPAGAGKSTIAKEVAKRLCIEFVDTGAMYRALTYKILKLSIDPNDYLGIIEILTNTKIDFRNQSIYLDNVNVDKEIRENYVSQNVSYIASIKEVREKMVQLQQQMAKSKSIIMDGRDIGSVVLPNADYKFFVTASVKERALRRYNELVNSGETNISLSKIESDIIKRDNIDSNREIAPLKKVEDAYCIDTTDKTIEECVNMIVSIVLGR
ncbi:(d)CMP kinase [Wansuia hejianensis]|uniref:Cytidylate kinase n=1 Tax=Wansuia hejianensis TaxID=2763667 RepID=A0A926IHD5_9FIRM|nr:(d)CMP kinase [Wansuia hejianensis]MBC8590547.1 (d)CMP kinase [Wansuia hejianensis]